MMSRIIAIANQKGGVGKTTTAVNLAAAIAERGAAGKGVEKTLLIDLDPQGNATSGLGIDRATLSASIYDVFTGEKTLPEVIQQLAPIPLLLAPATRDLIGAEVELAADPERATYLARALKELVVDYSYILVDCPPSLGLLTINALTAADSVLVPLQCEYYALEGLSALLDTIQRVRGSLNPRLCLEGLLLTMFDVRTNLSHEVAEDVNRNFPGRVFTTVIPRTVRLAEAPSFGKPILVYAPSSPAAECYRNLAAEVLHGA